MESNFLHSIRSSGVFWKYFWILAYSLSILYFFNTIEFWLMPKAIKCGLETLKIFLFQNVQTTGCSDIYLWMVRCIWNSIVLEHQTWYATWPCFIWWLSSDILRCMYFIIMLKSQVEIQKHLHDVFLLICFTVESSFRLKKIFEDWPYVFCLGTMKSRIAELKHERKYVMCVINYLQCLIRCPFL